MTDKPGTPDDSTESVNVLDPQHVSEYPITPEGIAERDLLLPFKLTSWEMVALLRALIEAGKERGFQTRIGVACQCPKCRAVDHVARRVADRIYAAYKTNIPQHLPPDAEDLEGAEEAKTNNRVN